MIDDFGNVCCDTCGEMLEIGKFPFCPHDPIKEVYIERDEIPGGITLENYGRDPVTFYSHSQRKAYMVKHELNCKEKFAPFPGTDRDPAGVQNPMGYVDAQTLENGRILMTRGKTKEWDPVESGVLKNTFSLRATRQDAIAVAAGDTRRSSRIGRRIGHASGKK